MLLALLLILGAAALAPTPQAQAALPEPAVGAATVPRDAEPAPAATTPAPGQAQPPPLAELESKPAASLSVAELLTLSEGRALRKRQDVASLARKLREQPDTVKEPAVQAVLLRLAADPDTALSALGAMAEAQAPVGPDLLWEVSTSRAFAPSTAELARTLLLSRDVRPGVSPALAVALELRGAEGCEAVQSALPKARSDGDRRALPYLTRLNVRRGCGADKADDCYSCLRSRTKEVIGATNAVKRRAAPSFPPR